MRLASLLADQASARRATALLAVLLAASMLATLLLAAHAPLLIKMMMMTMMWQLPGMPSLQICCGMVDYGAPEQLSREIN